jgi:hypothetical protein
MAMFSLMDSWRYDNNFDVTGLRIDNDLYMCGSGTYGQQGDGTTNGNYSLKKIDIGNKTPVALSLGAFNACLICSDNTMFVWGKNEYGELGLGDNTTRLSPVQITLPNSKIPKSVTFTQYSLIVLCTDGTVFRTGKIWYNVDVPQSYSNTFTQLQTAINKTVKSIRAGTNHVLIFYTDNTIQGFGNNQDGQLGLGTNSDEYTLTNISLINGRTAKSIHCVGDTSLILTTDNTIQMTGNLSYFFGSTSTNSFVEISLAKTPRFISTSIFNAFIIYNDDSVQAFGKNMKSSLGLEYDTAVSTPQTVNMVSGKTIYAILPSGNHTIFIYTDGSIYVVGSNGSSQLCLGLGATDKTVQTLVLPQVAFIPSLASAPGIPTINSVTQGNGQAIVAFSPPASDGGAAITSYTVTSTPGSFTATGASSPITVTGLSNGTAYTFRITATNSAGTSSPSSSSNSVTPSAGGGGAGDPYVTTVKNESYKLPIIDASIRFYQGVVDNKVLTVNTSLKTISSKEMVVENLHSFLELKKSLSPSQAKEMMKSIFEKQETLSFFEKVYIHYDNNELQLNVWNQKFEVESYKGSFKTSSHTDLSMTNKCTNLYGKYKNQTLKVDVGSASVFISVYDAPMVRSGIFVEAPNMELGNGVLVNTLSPSGMKISSLSDLTPVETNDSGIRKVTKEYFVDADGYRVREIISYV